jgi:hypothetical protein
MFTPVFQPFCRSVTRAILLTSLKGRLKKYGFIRKPKIRFLVKSDPLLINLDRAAPILLHLVKKNNRAYKSKTCSGT